MASLASPERMRERATFEPYPQRGGCSTPLGSASLRASLASQCALACSPTRTIFSVFVPPGAPIGSP